ncbi:PadR family transcriptional regulator [Streptomyces sp. TRM 70361]|uniref:PadR family transcriptional regulator n=1 Tax=Streptomyces sp. TRM 70361 TaxID=3116553 RepID=UPI002E7B1E58|nr:PadR family transcriptional regulator [Streptomyces sp. TRM 70361]MEE1942659.1 PadR family transcriptional regulator [Streptomyces sp. TRM 70361]
MPTTDPSTSWLRGTLPLVLAAVLAESDHHGYALVQRLGELGFGKVRGGALYPVLGRMEQDGLVTARWEAGEGGPGRKVYRLTGAGRLRLDEERARWRAFSAAMDGLLEQSEEAEQRAGQAREER